MQSREKRTIVVVFFPSIFWEAGFSQILCSRYITHGLGTPAFIHGCVPLHLSAISTEKQAGV